MQSALFSSTHATQQMTSTNDCETETPAPTEKILTIKDVCKRLNVSRTTVWRLTHEHGLRVIRVGGLRRIREHDLVIWLERHCTSGNGGSQTSERKGSGSP
jgi:excisionase family DNA binding protein